MTPQLQKPSLQHILALEAELVAQYASQDTAIREMRETLEMRAPIAIPDELRLVDIQIHDPSGADEVQRISAALSVNPFAVTIIPASPADTAQRNATLREKFSEEVMKVAGQRTPGFDTFTMAVDAAVGDGGAWTKLVFSKDLWENRYSIKPDQYEREYQEDLEQRGDRKRKRIANAVTDYDKRQTDFRGGRGDNPGAYSEPEDDEPMPKTGSQRYIDATDDAAKAAGPPFTWVCCDALTIYPVWQGVKLGEVLEIEKRPRSAVFRQYRLGYDKGGNITGGRLIAEEMGQGSSEPAGRNEVRVLQHWDDTWCTVVIVGGNLHGQESAHVLKQWRHRYKRPPYFFAPGLMRNYWRNRKVGWGVAATKRYLINYRSFLWTLHAQVCARDALTPLVEETSPDQASMSIGQAGTKQTPTAPQKWNLREIIRLEAGRTLKPLAWPQVAESLRQQIQLVSEAIDRLTTPRVTSDIGSGLEGAGFAISQVLQETKIRHNPITQSIERMLVDAIKFMWHLVTNVVKEKVWVYAEGDDGWIGCGPDDLKDTVAVKVTLDPEKPSAKLIERRYHLEGIKGGIESLDEAIEAEGRNPDEVRLGIALDRMRQSPWYTKLQDQYVLDEAGMGDLLKEAQQVASSGMLPGMENVMGAPTAMGGAPPGMGGPVVPDMANLAMAPGGGGLGPTPPGAMGPAPVPTQSAAPGIQWGP